MAAQGRVGRLVQRRRPRGDAVRAPGVGADGEGSSV